MDYALSELLQNYSNNGGVTACVYSSLYGTKTKYNVNASNFGKFIDGYANLALNDEDSDQQDGVPPSGLCLAEVIEGKTTLPLMGCFAFKFDVEEGDEERSYYGEDLILKIIKCYQKAITDLLTVTPNLYEYLCCVQEGHSYRKGEFVYKNLQIQFPYCQVDIKYTRKIFKPYVEKLLRQQKVMDSFDTSPVGDWKDLTFEYDYAVPLYRSSLDPQSPHLAYTHLFGIIKDEDIKNSSAEERELGQHYNPLRHTFIMNGKVPLSTVPFDDHDDDVDYHKYWIPLFLSIHYWCTETIPLINDVDSDKEVKKSGAYNVNELDSDNPVRLAQSLLPLLSPDRATKDYSWLDIGRVLYTIYKGSDDGLNLWSTFSGKASVPGRDKSMCEYRYREFKDNLLSIATLAWYAREDNPGGYQEWHSSWCQKTLSDAMTTNHVDVAKAIYRIFWLDYVFCSESGMWYEYRTTHFHKIGKEPIPLRKKILEKFIPIFEKMRVDLSKGSYEDPDKDGADNKDVEYKIKAVNNLITKLKNENYRSTIIKSIKDLFHIEEFEKKCDKNHFLTATANYVLEVVDKKVRPRTGKPEDFMLKFSGIYYNPDYTWESFWVKEVLTWFDQITLRDQDLRHYFLKRIASFLRGLNPEKLFDVWTGDNGNNSKSILTKTIQYMFGEYFIDFPVSLLTGGGKNSSGPSPELAQAANARGAILAEPDDRESMKGGIIKRITGGDRLFTRSLNENGGSMDLTFKTIMVCNRIPDIANIDKALINRFVIMPFLATWTENAPDSVEEQFRTGMFKLDPFFEAKIPELAKALLWISVNYYTYYANEGLPFPNIVKEHIKKHWEDNDFYLQFISEKIEYVYKDGDKKEIDTNITLASSDLYPHFTRWFKDFYPGISSPTSNQFMSDIKMQSRLGPQPKRGVWFGIRVRISVPNLPAGNNI